MSRSLNRREQNKAAVRIMGSALALTNRQTVCDVVRVVRVVVQHHQLAAYGNDNDDELFTHVIDMAAMVLAMLRTAHLDAPHEPMGTLGQRIQKPWRYTMWLNTRHRLRELRQADPYLQVLATSTVAVMAIMPGCSANFLHNNEYAKTMLEQAKVQLTRTIDRKALVDPTDVDRYVPHEVCDRWAHPLGQARHKWWAYFRTAALDLELVPRTPQPPVLRWTLQVHDAAERTGKLMTHMFLAEFKPYIRMHATYLPPVHPVSQGVASPVPAGTQTQLAPNATPHAYRPRTSSATALNLRQRIESMVQVPRQRIAHWLHQHAQTTTKRTDSGKCKRRMCMGCGIARRKRGRTSMASHVSSRPSERIQRNTPAT